MAAQAAAYPAMRYNHGVTGYFGKPIHDAGVEVAETFSLARREIPRIFRTPHVVFRLVCGDFGHGQAAPCAEVDFLQPGVGSILDGEGPSLSERFPWFGAL